ncbi:MAG: hypothetical protein ACI4C1_10075 [Lachnospiraceae bacterium]
MKNTIFNVALYKDAFRQSRMIGVMALIFIALEAILVPLGYHIENLSMNVPSYYSSGGVAMAANEITPIHLIEAGENALNVLPLLIALIVLVTPIMTLYLFRFENSRAASDCYHAMPQTKICLFFSFHAAIFTWIVGIVAINFVLFAIMVNVLSGVTAALMPVIQCSLAVLAGCLLVQGAVALAVSVTGTTFTNLLVTVMIIFAPRVLLFVAKLLILEQIPYWVSTGNEYASHMNIPVNLLLGVLDYDHWLSGFSSWPPVIYTSLVGMLYFALAVVLYARKKSETASHAATSSQVQTILRMIPAFFVSLVGVYLIWVQIFYYKDYRTIGADSMELFFIVLMYILSLLTYMLYELMTTRQWKNVIHALPKFIWIFVLNFVFLAGCYAGYQTLAHQTVQLENLTGYHIQSYYNENEWYALKTKEIFVNDEKTNQLLLNRLSEQIEALDNGQFYNKYYNYYVEGDSKEYYYGYNFELQTENTMLVRQIYLTDSEWKQVEEAIKSNKEYQAAYMTLPSLELDIYSISSDYFYLNVSNESSSDYDMSDVENYYETLKREIKEGGFEKWYDIFKNKTDSIDNIRIRCKNNTWMDIPLSFAYPESTELYLNLCLDSNADEKRYLMDIMGRGDWINADIILTWCGVKNGIWQETSLDMIFEEDLVDGEQNLIDEEFNYEDAADSLSYGLVYHSLEDMQLLFTKIKTLADKKDYRVSDGYLYISGSFYGEEYGSDYLDIVLLPCSIEEAKLIWQLFEADF